MLEIENTQQLPSVNEMLTSFRQAVGLEDTPSTTTKDPFAPLPEMSPDIMAEQNSNWAPNEIMLPTQINTTSPLDTDEEFKGMYSKVEGLAQTIADEVDNPESPITIENAEQTFMERYREMEVEL